MGMQCKYENEALRQLRRAVVVAVKCVPCKEDFFPVISEIFYC